MQLTNNERIDYLFHPDLQIVQSPDVFTFSLDAVLLARFVYVPIQKGNLIDLCSGTGAIPIILSQRSKGDITAVEIQPKLHEMAEKSMVLNQIQNRVNPFCLDIKEAPKVLGQSQFDIVTCNPPYFRKDQAFDQNMNPHMALARHEISVTLREVIDVSSRLVKQGGKVAYVHRPERLIEILALMRQYRLEPKRLMFIHPKQGKDANMVLVEGIKDGKEGLKVLSPLTVYQADGTYTDELEAFCNGKV